MRKVIVLAALSVLALPAAASTPTDASGQSLFGMAALRDPSAVPLRSWAAVLARITAEAPDYTDCERAGRCAVAGANGWAALLRRLNGRPRREQLDAVDRFANASPYRSDAQAWGRRDYWASPLEFLARSGDCEDYAIFKYVSMRRLGMAAADLRVTVVHDTRRNLAHAVLAAAADGDWLILDNLSDRIRAQREITNYVPYYSVNEVGRWMHVPAPALVVSAGAVPSPQR